MTKSAIGLGLNRFQWLHWRAEHQQLRSLNHEIHLWQTIFHTVSFDVEHFMRERRLITAHKNVVHPKINRWLDSQYFADSCRSIVFFFHCLLLLLLFVIVVSSININILFYKYIKNIVDTNLPYCHISDFLAAVHIVVCGFIRVDRSIPASWQRRSMFNWWWRSTRL